MSTDIPATEEVTQAPAGNVLVPVKLTRDMIDRVDEMMIGDIEAVWAELLAATPQTADTDAIGHVMEAMNAAVTYSGQPESVRALTPTFIADRARQCLAALSPTHTGEGA